MIRSVFCKTSLTPWPYVLLLLSTIAFPATAGNEELSTSGFNNKYEIVYNPVRDCSEEYYYHVWPDYSCLPYTENPFVAYKGEHPDNIFYRAQRFDISGMTSLAQFKDINANDARNRVIYDDVYDDPNAAEGEQYCLDAQLAWVDNFYSYGPNTTKPFDGRIYIRHWAFTSAPEGQKPNVVELGEYPTETSHSELPAVPVPRSKCEIGTSDECGWSLDYSYTEKHPEKLCISKGQHAGFISQLFENDDDSPRYTQEDMRQMVNYMATHQVSGPITAGLYFFVDVMLLATAYSYDDDDAFYPASQSYTWGALKRMTEQNISAWADKDVLGFRVWAIPDEQDIHNIFVHDYYANSGCKNVFKANVTGTSATEHWQYCWKTETTSGMKTFYSDPWPQHDPNWEDDRVREIFYLATNWPDLAGHVHYRVKASRKTSTKSTTTSAVDAPTP